MPSKPEQLTLDWAQQQAEEADADLVVSYSFDEGVLVCGATRQWKEAIKSTGFDGKRFRFSRSLPEDCAWYVPSTRGKFMDRGRLERTAEGLRRAGAVVEVRYETPHGGPTVADIERREAARRERTEARVERHEGAAKKLRAKADREFASASLSEERTGIPFGQPILVGHHSERKHRRVIEKAERAGQRGLEASRKAETRERRARASERRLEQLDDPGTMQRKIKKLEAEIRDFDRRLEGTSAKQFGAAKGEHRERILAMKAERAAELQYWREQLVEKLEHGPEIFDATSFRPGDVVQGKHGWAVVQKVNAKSLSVAYTNPVLKAFQPSKLTYDYVSERATPHMTRVLSILDGRGTATLDQIQASTGYSKAEVTGLVADMLRAHLLDPTDETNTRFQRTWVPQKKGAKKKAPKKPTRFKWKKWVEGAYVAAPFVRHKGQGPVRQLIARRDRLYRDTWNVVAQHLNEPDNQVAIGQGRSLTKAKERADDALDAGTITIID